jgi:hypothetical protein
VARFNRKGTGVVLGGFGVAILGLTLWQDHVADRLRVEGTRTDAVVVRHHRSSIDANSQRYSHHVFLSFEAQGQTHETSASSEDSRFFEEHPVGSSVEIAYLPSDPAVTSLASDLTDEADARGTGFLVASVVLIVLGAAALFVRRRQNASA